MNMRLWIECGYCNEVGILLLGKQFGPNDLNVDFGDDTIPMVNVIKGARDMSQFSPCGGLIPCMPILKVFPRLGLIDRVHFLASAMISFHVPAHALLYSPPHCRSI